MNPQRVIEHIENQNLIPFNANKHEQLMAELNALPVKQEKGVIYFKEVPNEPMVKQETIETLTPVQRWIELDKQINGGDELSQDNQNFWKMYQTSKKFKQLEEDDAELSSYLAQRQG